MSDDECVGCTGNNIGLIGAQYIGDGLKSLTSLTTLNLWSEWCGVWCGVVWCVVLCCLSVDNSDCVLDVQTTRLEMLEHNSLAMVSSH